MVSRASLGAWSCSSPYTCPLSWAATAAMANTPLAALAHAPTLPQVDQGSPESKIVWKPTTRRVTRFTQTAVSARMPPAPSIALQRTEFGWFVQGLVAAEALWVTVNPEMLQSENPAATLLAAPPQAGEHPVVEIA